FRPLSRRPETGQCTAAALATLPDEVSGLRGQALRNWQRDCAMIFQQFKLVPRLDVLTNVMLGRLNHRSTLMSLLNIFTREERV
ncbi:hypothetical protein AB9E31_36370, partial [Rhizobium leguminosarum]